MNVFVVGTGRCGTTTFSKACSHITNYTSGHESHAGTIDFSYIHFPDQHIEVDPHLTWMLGLLIQKYPDALFVHLFRNRNDVVASWFRRGVDAHRGAAPLLDVMCQTNCQTMSRTTYRRALGFLYDMVCANIEGILRNATNSMSIRIDRAPNDFLAFWDRIGAEGNLVEATAEFELRYNATR